jgi:hypothetical protein
MGQIKSFLHYHFQNMVTTSTDCLNQELSDVTPQ